MNTKPNLKKAVVIVGTALLAYLIYKSLKDINLESLKTSDIDLLDIDFAKKHFSEHKIENKNLKKVICKLDEENLGTEYQEEKTQKYVLAYYDEVKEEIIPEKSIVVIPQKVHINLRDAFNDKNMIIIED
ncbi:hypothetical protein EDL98_05810 [Ornithobacterium rhinotracheale]|nr:hypothetical protein [Ornithobacterium rhinotracheale]MRJ10598.1 hypothetical protein [Ornithobacterium rhinotracheale]